jgi:DNA polymerase III delta subunit-like protein
LSSAGLLERLGRQPEQIPGTLLLSGPDPDRLEQEALHLAARLLCPQDDPGHQCDACRRVLAGLHPDLLRIDPEGVQIRIDRIREALLFAAGRPYEAARRVAVVSRAEMLGVEAGNALLKSLEEPGRFLRWILTTSRPEALLPTILSRCVALPVALASPARVRGEWRERGFSAEDAEDLALLRPPAADAAAALAAYREARSQAVSALEAGLVRRDLAVLLMLADRMARAAALEGRLLADLLADAAVSASSTAEALRHRAVAGSARELGRRLPQDVLREAALRAADAPPDVRRGNRRLHFERVLLDLYLAG